MSGHRARQAAEQARALGAASADASGQARPLGRCAVCGSRLEPGARPPFCSERCKLIDLSRWLDGGYRFPVGEREAHTDVPDDGEPQEHPCNE
jgi:uncharacterized protein